MSTPVALTVDGAGDVFVANYGNGAVKEIVAVGGSTSSTSTVLTLGSGFNSTYGVAVDAAGNVYVADQGNNLVKEILAVGGSIPATSPTILTLGSGFSRPSSVAVDGAGNVYVADTGHAAAKQIPLATPPSLAFPSTAAGSTSSPLSVQLQNIGNAALTFPAPSSGSNPLAGSGFITDASTTCPVVASGGTAGSLVSGATCLEVVDFQPSMAGSYSSTLQLTDNSLTSSTATQSIPLTGTATAVLPTITSYSPNPVPSGPGITVIVTGTNFSSSSQVYFYTANGSFLIDSIQTNVVSSTQLSYVTDSDLGSGQTYCLKVQQSSGASSCFAYVVAGTQTINFTQPSSPAYLKTTATLIATGGNSGNPVTFSIISGPATLSGTNNSTITYTGAGTVVVAADQTGNSSYTAAPEVTRTVIVQLQSIFVANSAGSVSSFMTMASCKSPRFPAAASVLRSILRASSSRFMQTGTGSMNMQTTARSTISTTATVPPLPLLWRSTAAAWSTSPTATAPSTR